MWIGVALSPLGLLGSVIPLQLEVAEPRSPRTPAVGSPGLSIAEQNELHLGRGGL